MVWVNSCLSVARTSCLSWAIVDMVVCVWSVSVLCSEVALMASELWVLRFLGSWLVCGCVVVRFLDVACVYDTVRLCGDRCGGGLAYVVGFLADCGGGMMHWRRASAYVSS